MKKFLLYLWQLPQNILGLLVIWFTKAQKIHYIDSDRMIVYNYWLSEKYRFGVSLGKYIIFGGKDPNKCSIFHEKGHQVQSKRLGWLYLIIIGLPSITFNISDTLFHKDWTVENRLKWYYNLPWERNANKQYNITWKEIYYGKKETL